MQFHFKPALAGAILCAFFSSSVRAETVVNPSTEYLKRIKTSETVEPMGETPFGESISLYTGQVSFRQTDISFPGIGPTITLARTYEASGSPTSYMLDRPMGDWDLSIPRIETLIPGQAAGKGGTWTVQSGSPHARCSQFAEVANPFAYGLGWWHGYQLVTPDGSSQSLLRRSAANTLAPGNNVSAYPIVTAAHWMVSCLAGTSNAMPGEAFLATGPDGTRYWFDHLSYGTSAETLAEHLREQGPPGGGLKLPGKFTDYGKQGPDPTVYYGVDVLLMPRLQAQMKLTRIEDRFGNYLVYTYNAAGQLLEINSSDSRRVALTWRTDAPLVERITLQPGSAMARVWQYQYSGGALVRVVQPDSSAWTFSMASAATARVEAVFPAGVCGIRSASQLAGGGLVMTLGHPSGLTGQFELGLRHHGRAQVPTSCPVQGVDPQSEPIPPIYDALSLVARTFSGPGVVTGTWRYSYSPAFASTAAECAAGAQCRDIKWVEVTDPQSRTSHHNFSTRWGHMEGKLLGSVAAVSSTGLDNPAGLQTETSTYASPAGGAYPSSLGTLLTDANTLSNNATSELVSPENLRQTVRQGVAFNRQTLTFDRFGQPLVVKRFSTLGSRTDTTEYWPVTSQWVLGQVSKVIDGASGKTISQVAYGATILPTETYSFGLLQQSLGYNTNGTLATARDGRNLTSSLSDWYRGIPRLVTFADGSSIGATVDEVGNLKTVRNELGSTTSYAYDQVGRMSGVTFPAGDSAAWNGTSLSFVSVPTAEYGLPAGHWRHIRQTGNGRVSTYYNAQWRPVLTLTEDMANGASKSFVVNSYDNAGQLTFSSYPVASLATVNDALDGIRTVYDALGRTTQVRQDSELGVLVSSTDYLGGFQTRTTNPRGFSTTVGYQAFDSPATDAPVVISMPEGVTTTIARDGFGKSLAVTRSGSFAGVPVSAVRRYVYDPQERLCKTINPESGAALVDYDVAGNIAWTAEGTAFTALDCNRTSVALAARTNRGYDSRNRVTTVSTPGGTANLVTAYDADGLVKSLTAANPGGNNVVTTYGYNKRRLLTSETSLNGTTNFVLGYGYSANGHASTLAYPDGQVVAYNPDGLGRPTLIASAAGVAYARAISYYPNGAISRFEYGNGAVHTMTQNRRRLPAVSSDVGASVLLKDTYVFDANGNVDYITDGKAAGANNRSRDMGYDGLDRLVVADAAYQWNKGTFSYDALDNIRSADLGTRLYRYNYDATTNRLSNIKNPAGVVQVSLGYDAGGNTTAKNSQALVFDSANRLSQVTGQQVYRYDGQGRRVQTTDADGKTTLWIYGQSGQVLFTHEPRRSRNLAYVYLGNTQIATRAWAIGSGAVSVNYQHTDALGSPVVESDSAASPVKYNNYSPYGEAYGATSIDGTGYTGHVMDQGTGLTYMQQRYYDPLIGRLLSVDPVAARTGGDNFNRYWYANNNPYKFTDPDGREAGGGYATGQYTMQVSSYDGVGTVVDFLPGIGDAKGFYDAYQNPTPVNIAAAVVGLAGPIGDGAAKGLKQGSNILENAAKGKAGEAITRAKLGDTVKGEQVSFKTNDGTRTRTDFVTTGNGVVETKTGNATMSPGQTKLAADIAAGRTVTPVGQNAAKAGLVPGQPTKMASCTVDRPGC